MSLKQSLRNLSTNWITYCHALLHREWDLTKTKNFTAKTEYLNLKAHSNNVEMQSNITLATQIQILLTLQMMESFLKSMLQVNKENDQWGEIQKLITIF